MQWHSTYSELKKDGNVHVSVLTGVNVATSLKEGKKEGRARARPTHDCRYGLSLPVMLMTIS